jgi:hypothetical protein
MSYTVSKYDVADDPNQAGEWTEVQDNLDRDRAIEVVKDLVGRGYDLDNSIAIDEYRGGKLYELNVDLPGIDQVFEND